jgi:drug/metabolite transporter (DMT)-like permease
MNYKEILIGLILINYGILKLFIGFTTILTSDEFKNYIRTYNPSLKILIPYDETLAAKMLEITFIIFGIYSLLHGLDKFHVITKNIQTFIDSRKTVYLLYGIIGIFLTLFYTLVVYTNIPIEKNIKELDRYKVVGIISGLSFLIMLPILLIFHKIVDHGIFSIFKHTRSIICFLSICIIFFFMFKILKNTNIKRNNTLTADIITLSMIPLNTL